jgi:hypothetical protein
MPRSWKEIVQEKQETRTKLTQPYLAETIDDHEQDGDDSVLRIDDVDTLVDLMANGSLTAQKVVSAYIRRYAS